MIWLINTHEVRCYDNGLGFGHIAIYVNPETVVRFALPASRPVVYQARALAYKFLSEERNEQKFQIECRILRIFLVVWPTSHKDASQQITALAYVTPSRAFSDI